MWHLRHLAERKRTRIKRWTGYLNILMNVIPETSGGEKEKEEQKEGRSHPTHEYEDSVGESNSSLSDRTGLNHSQKEHGKL